MLDLAIGHPGTCEKCGCQTDCARVTFWDSSFVGLLCWDDLKVMVVEKSKDPECRKKSAQMRDRMVGASHSNSKQTSISEGESDGCTRLPGRTHTTTEGRASASGYSQSTGHSGPSNDTQGDQP